MLACNQIMFETGMLKARSRKFYELEVAEILTFSGAC